MTSAFLIRYAAGSVTPETRLAHFAASEPRLTWVGLLLAQHPQADVYLVGGTVRDALIGRTSADLDMVVRGVAPTELEHWLLAHGAAEFVGRFGTFKFIPHGQGGTDPIDIALPRTEHADGALRGGRRDMDVRFNHLLPIKEDLSRRDFTINAMAFDLRHKRLVDPFLGLRDLNHGTINAVLDPSVRFQEDGTRMLRALRLASQLSFGIDAATWSALCAHIDRLNITDVDENGTHAFIVPREAIGREFLLGFVEHPVHTLDLWRECRALHLFMPELAQLEGTLEADNEDALKKTRTVLHMLCKSSVLANYGLAHASASVLLAGLLSFVEAPKARAAYLICRRLFLHQFPKRHKANVDCKRVFWLLEHLHDFERIDPASMRPSAFERLMLSGEGAELLALMHAVFLATGRHSAARERIHVAHRLRETLMARVEAEGQAGRLPRLLTGKDLTALGIEPGPRYRDILERVRDAQWTRRIHTKEEAELLARDILRTA